MRNALFAIPLVATVLVTSLLGTALAGPAVHSQKATEIYIPIGMSPGVSGVSSVIGEVVSFDVDARTLLIRNDDGEHTATLTDDTHVWLDRSGSGDANIAGTERDFEPGRRCEIKYVYDGTTRLAEAEWIKIGVS